MSLIDTHTFKFICHKDKEELIFSNPNSLFVYNDTIVSDLGYALCSLLNSEKDIEKFKLKMEKNISNYIKNESPINEFDYIKLIFSKFIRINKYLVITENYFIECINQIMNELSIFPRTKTIIEIYKECLSQTLGSIIKSIYTGKELIKYNVNEIHLPSVYFSFKIRDKKPQSAIYEYTLSNIDELIKVSYYQLMLNKYRIKNCKYPNCNKFFIPSAKQVWCDNPCPDNPNCTCNELQKTLNRKGEVSELEREIDDLNIKLKRFREQYRYYASIETRKRDKEMIINNAENLKNISKDLKRKIIGNSNDTQVNYLKVYKNFLDEIESNLKASPKIFKIKKPNY